MKLLVLLILKRGAGVMLFVPLLPLELLVLFVVLLLLMAIGTSLHMCLLESYLLQSMQLLVSAL